MRTFADTVGRNRPCGYAGSTHPVSRLALPLGLIVALAANSPARSDEKQDSKQLSAAALKQFQAEAAEYSITANGGKLNLNQTPVLRWTNPLKEGQDGAVFLWTKNERPEAIGCCFTYTYSGELRHKHQLHSLSTKPVEARIDNSVVWQPRTAGVTFTPIPRAGSLATSASRQAIQMRHLARRFAVEVESDKGVKSELRLMPVPLATYSPKNSECSTGALFSFALGTDPDAILIIENRMVNSVPTWTWAFARFHFNKLTATLDDKPVWSVPAEYGMKGDFRATTRFRDSTYVSFRPE